MGSKVFVKKFQVSILSVLCQKVLNCEMQYFYQLNKHQQTDNLFECHLSQRVFVAKGHQGRYFMADDA